ncbi:MAG: hypothetical protein QOF48_3972 [Verrucomicrobiota bacterium]|jgi:hypothetical protein
MRFNPIHNPVVLPKPPQLTKAIVDRRTPDAGTPAAGPISLGQVPDTTLAFMLVQAAGRAADLGKCAALVPEARIKFVDWLAHRAQYGHPVFPDWRPAFTSFAAIFIETHGPAACVLGPTAHPPERPHGGPQAWLNRPRLCLA